MYPKRTEASSEASVFASASFADTLPDISYNEAVESKTNVCGRLKTEEEAIRAGIEYVEEQLKNL
jgi:hypothetical protein